MKDTSVAAGWSSATEMLGSMLGGTTYYKAWA